MSSETPGTQSYLHNKSPNLQDSVIDLKKVILPVCTANKIRLDTSLRALIVTVF